MQCNINILVFAQCLYIPPRYGGREGGREREREVEQAMEEEMPTDGYNLHTKERGQFG